MTNHFRLIGTAVCTTDDVDLTVTELSENYDTAREIFETHSEYKLAGGRACLFSNIF